MGWSCSQKAGETMDRWSEFCAKQTGQTNVFKVGEVFFMWEVSNVEHPDGSITGKVLRFVDFDPKGDSNSCFPAGNFKIEPDGSVKRAPAILKGL